MSLDIKMYAYVQTWNLHNKEISSLDNVLDDSDGKIVPIVGIMFNMEWMSEWHADPCYDFYFH